MPTNIQVSDSPSIDYLKSTWAQIVLALEPLVDTLPEPYKSHFNSPIKLLIGNKISLGIIPAKHMWSYIEDAGVIYNMLLDIDYLGYDLDFILMEFFDPYFTRLGLSMSINGEFLLRGPMSRQEVHQKHTQELVGISEQGLKTLQGGP